MGNLLPENLHLTHLQEEYFSLLCYAAEWLKIKQRYGAEVKDKDATNGYVSILRSYYQEADSIDNIREHHFLVPS